MGKENADQRLLNSPSFRLGYGQPSELDLHVRIRGIPDDGYGDGLITSREEAAKA